MGATATHEGETEGMNVPDFVVDWFTSLYGAGISVAVLFAIGGVVLDLAGNEVLSGLFGAVGTLLFAVTLLFYALWRAMIAVSERA